MASTKGEWRVEQREKERASCRQTNTFPPCQQSLFSRNLLGPRHSYFLVLPSFSPLFYISKRVAYSGRLLAITNNGIDSLDDLRLHPLCALSPSLSLLFLLFSLPIFGLPRNRAAVSTVFFIPAFPRLPMNRQLCIILFTRSFFLSHFLGTIYIARAARFMDKHDLNALSQNL